MVLTIQQGRHLLLSKRASRVSISARGGSSYVRRTLTSGITIDPLSTLGVATKHAPGDRRKHHRRLTGPSVNLGTGVSLDTS